MIESIWFIWFTCMKGKLSRLRPRPSIQSWLILLPLNTCNSCANDTANSRFSYICESWWQGLNLSSTVLENEFNQFVGRLAKLEIFSWGSWGLKRQCILYLGSIINKSRKISELIDSGRNVELCEVRTMDFSTTRRKPTWTSKTRSEVVCWK